MPNLLTKQLHDIITCRINGWDRKHVSKWLVITLASVFKEAECNPPGKINVYSRTWRCIVTYRFAFYEKYVI